MAINTNKIKENPNKNASVQLLAGETWIAEDNKFENHNQVSDKDINERYQRGEIRIITEQARYSLPTIPDMLKTSMYELNPEYQRRRRWNNVRKSRLIESLIINVPVPPIFLYETEFSRYEVMDGLQRLTTIDDFYKGKFKLSGLTEWPELNNRTYSTLPDQIKRGIDRRYLSSVILLNETAKDPNQAHYLKQIVFERLNSGGEKLSAQETRNALYSGDFNQLCIELARNKQFREMWQLPREDEVDALINKNDDEIEEEEISLAKLNAYRKMEDVEMVLRFFAYRHLDKLSSPLDIFLDECLKRANSFPQETRNNLAVIFEKTINLIYNLFGSKAFCPPGNVGRRERPLKIIYDPMMQVFSLFIDYEQTLIKHKDFMRERIYQKAPPDFFKGRDNTKKDVEKRIKYFRVFLEDII